MWWPARCPADPGVKPLAAPATEPLPHGLARRPLTSCRPVCCLSGLCLSIPALESLVICCPLGLWVAPVHSPGPCRRFLSAYSGAAGCGQHYSLSGPSMSSQQDFLWQPLDTCCTHRGMCCCDGGCLWDLGCGHCVCHSAGNRVWNRIECARAGTEDRGGTCLPKTVKTLSPSPSCRKADRESCSCQAICGPVGVALAGRAQAVSLPRCQLGHPGMVVCGVPRCAFLRVSVWREVGPGQLQDSRCPSPCPMSRAPPLHLAGRCLPWLVLPLVGMGLW